jgi:hypothetical protein
MARPTRRLRAKHFRAIIERGNGHIASDGVDSVHQRTVKRSLLKRKTPLVRKRPMKRGRWARWKKNATIAPQVFIPYTVPPRQPKARLRRSWIKRVGKRHEVDRQIYLIQKERFLKEHPICEANVDHELPFGKIRVRLARSEDVHHVKGRGKYYLDESTWMAVCRKCHDWIHSHANSARAMGLLQF